MMIKGIGNDEHGRPLLLLGLSRRNCELLLQGKPIHVEHGALPGLEIGVLIVAAETEQEIVTELAPMLPRGSIFAKPRPGEIVVVGPDGVERKPNPKAGR